MKAERIARVLELVGDFVPDVRELTLFVPAFFGLYSAARALGFGVDQAPDATPGVSMTFSCLAWVTLTSLAHGRTEGAAEITNDAPRSEHSSSASHGPQRLEVRLAIDRTAETQFKEEMDSVYGR